MYACNVHFGKNLGADDEEECDSPSCPFYQLAESRKVGESLKRRVLGLEKLLEQAWKR